MKDTDEKGLWYNINQKKMLGEAAAEGLAAKAKKSGISIGVLRKVYNRGMAAWKTGHRPGTTPQQWGMARVNSYITKGKGTYHGADKDLREVAKDAETGLPKKYVSGLSKSTSKARAAHFSANDKLSDSNPAAYKPAPGDANAKTKPSKHTLKYRAMYGEEAIDEKSVSVAQQKIMGMALAYKRGEMPDASDEVKKIAKSMTTKELEDFAKTKHKGLPMNKENKETNMPSESTAEYGKSQAAIARRKQLAAMKPGEMDKLKRLRDMMGSANKKESVDLDEEKELGVGDRMKLKNKGTGAGSNQKIVKIDMIKGKKRYELANGQYVYNESAEPVLELTANQKAEIAKRKEINLVKRGKKAPEPKKKNELRPSATVGNVTGEDDSIIMQLRKAQDVDGKFDIRFHMGKKGTASKADLDTVLKFYDSISKPVDKRKVQIHLSKGGPAAVAALAKQLRSAGR
jgi:hypothetical protein